MLAKNYEFITKQTSWDDKYSLLPQENLVGVYPINKYPFITPTNRLMNLGVPVGMVIIDNPPKGGSNIEIKNHNHPELIEEKLFDSLLQLVSPQSKKNNKTKKLYKEKKTIIKNE